MLSLAPARLQHPDVGTFVDVLGAWRRDDIDELAFEPGDLQLLARLRAGEDNEEMLLD